MMCNSQLLKILWSLKNTAHSTKSIDQILTQAITTGLISLTRTWNAIIRAFSESPTPIKAILIYNHLLENSSVVPDKFTYPALFKACLHVSSLSKGKEVHARVMKIGLDYDLYVQNALIHFYGSGAQVPDARLMFDTMPERDVVSWNTLLGTYCLSSDSLFEVNLLFKKLISEGIKADSITLVTVLSACTQAMGIDHGRAVHAYVIKVGFGCILNLNNALLGMYTKCREMEASLRLIHEMGSQKDLVSYTILINGFAELGSIDFARDIFEGILDKDVVLWSSMVHAYVKAKRPKEALDLFKKMENDRMIPDEHTMASVLSACASLSDLQYGRVAHRFILRNNTRRDVFLGTGLINMYSKSGSLDDALVIFYKMRYKDVFTWTTIIEGLAVNGHGDKALTLFSQMEKQGIKPNEATFTSVLMACSRSGMIYQGYDLFNRMVGVYKIKPQIEHFGCLIDLLSRAGLLNQADEFVEVMSPEDRLIARKTLLSACINHSEFELGEKVANEMIQLGSQSPETHILVSNFYALAGQWAEVADARRNMKDFDMRKKPGISSVELQNII